MNDCIFCFMGICPIECNGHCEKYASINCGSQEVEDIFNAYQKDIDEVIEVVRKKYRDIYFN